MPDTSSCLWKVLTYGSSLRDYIVHNMAISITHPTHTTHTIAFSSIYLPTAP